MGGRKNEGIGTPWLAAGAWKERDPRKRTSERQHEREFVGAAEDELAVEAGVEANASSERRKFSGEPEHADDGEKCFLYW
jgi:hypothetical protein